MFSQGFGWGSRLRGRLRGTWRTGSRNSAGGLWSRFASARLVYFLGFRLENCLEFSLESCLGSDPGSSPDSSTDSPPELPPGLHQAGGTARYLSR